MLLAVVIASAVVLLLGWRSVALVGDVADIPRSPPMPRLPDLSLVRGLVGPAIAIGIIGPVQGAGVGRSVPNPDGSYPEPSQDFGGQGLANIACGLFQGMPVGGSLSSTAINVSAGAVTRWANIFAGILAAVLVLLFTDLIELVPMACMAGMLIVAGWQAIDFAEIADVQDAGMAPRMIMFLTFAVTLFLPMTAAVFLGVVLSLLYYVYNSAMRVRVVEIVREEDGSLREQAPPAELPSNQVTVLSLYGALYYAAAYTLEQNLPSPLQAERAVVVVRLRGLEEVGSTLIGVLERCAGRLRVNGGKLVLSGVSEGVLEGLRRTETTELTLEGDILLADEILGSSTNKALAAARAWLAKEQDRQAP